MAKVIHEWDKMAFLERIRPELKRFCGKRIAVKLHFGEPGNPAAFTPLHILPLTDLLGELGITFFLYDSSVAYPSPRGRTASHREAALAKGWGSLGEVRTDDDRVIQVKGRHLTYEVCAPLAEADGVLVVSHLKGHVCCGFGGALKNLGMGCLSKKSKMAIHDGGSPVFTGECSGCGVCVPACPIGGIELQGGKAVFVTCYGCSGCAAVCPTQAISPKVAPFEELLAGGAKAAASRFKSAYYLTFMGNITRMCDCERSPGEIIAKDCGWLASADPVAIDRAGHDIVTATAGEDVFLKSNLKSGLGQIEAAEKLGLGSMRYRS